MRKISAYLLILLVFFCLSFGPADSYAGDKENSSVSLPQGVKLADEKSIGETGAVQNENGKTQREEEIDSAQIAAGTLKPDIPEDKSFPVKKDTNELSFQEGGLAELRAYVDKSSITIGEKVTYTLEIDADNDLEAEFPSYVSGLGGFAVKDFGKDDKRIGKQRSRKTQWYLLDTYTTGSYVIPEQSVRVKLANGQIQVLRSPQIFVEVESVMDDGEKEAGLRDIKGPLTVNAEAPVIFAAVIAFIILAAAGIILWKLYVKKFSAGKIEPAFTPREIASRELGRIDSLGLIDKGKIKEYYYLVSLALRTYLENRFFLKAPEQTTEEFLESVVYSGKLEVRHINILKEYLNHCDLVKYAEFNPGKPQAELLLETTRHFIEETVGDGETGWNNKENGD